MPSASRPILQKFEVRPANPAASRQASPPTLPAAPPARETAAMTLDALTARLRDGVPLAQLLQVEAIALEPLTLRMPASPLALRPGGTTSGPALMALADVAMWAALLVANGEEDLSRTTQLAIQFLRAAGPGPVIAEPRILKPGRSLIYGEVWLRGEGEDRPAAHVTTQWAVLPKRG